MKKKKQKIIRPIKGTFEEILTSIASGKGAKPLNHPKPAPKKP